MAFNAELKYVYIQYIVSNHKICEYPYDVEEKVTNDRTTISEKIHKLIQNSKYESFDQRNKIKTDKGLYYFTVTEDKNFIFLYTDTGYSENKAFDFIDLIHSRNIINMTDDNGTLTHEGQLNLIYLFDEFKNVHENSELFEKVSEDIIGENEITINDNFKEEENTENLKKDKKVNEIDYNSEIKPVSRKFNNQTISVEQINTSTKVKYWIIRIIFIVCLILYLIIPIFVEKKETKLGSK